MHIVILNGPNLNLVGEREQPIYGVQSLSDYLSELTNTYKEHQFTIYQSNIEGELVDAIQQFREADAFIINAGAYTHTSLAIADAIKAVSLKYAVEVHISNIFSRETYRHTSYLSGVCNGIISGFGLLSYKLAVESCLLQQKN